jgi:hypothetical protein
MSKKGDTKGGVGEMSAVQLGIQLEPRDDNAVKL